MGSDGQWLQPRARWVCAVVGREGTVSRYRDKVRALLGLSKLSSVRKYVDN